MAFSFKLKPISISWPKFTWPQFTFLAKVRAYPWKSLPRRILRQVLALILSVLFLAISLLFLGYAGVHILTNSLGVEAQVADMSSLPNTPIGKYRLVYEGAGLFKGAVEKDGKKYDGIYYLYPAWPNYTEPAGGEKVLIWPAQKPLVAALPMTGRGWIVSIFFLVIGLVMFEFFLLAWTIH
jgi:hypothetical protein